MFFVLQNKNLLKLFPRSSLLALQYPLIQFNSFKLGRGKDWPNDELKCKNFPWFLSLEAHAIVCLHPSEKRNVLRTEQSLAASKQCYISIKKTALMLLEQTGRLLLT